VGVLVRTFPTCRLMSGMSSQSRKCIVPVVGLSLGSAEGDIDHHDQKRAMGLSPLGLFYLTMLWIGAGLLVLLVALVALSRKVKRSPVWINLCTSCMCPLSVQC
jgi:hypothetical protein